MRNSMRISLFAAVLAMAGFTAAVPAADTFKLDPVHSFAMFKIKHMNTSNTYGRFNGPEGTVVIDPDVSKSSLKISVKVDNVDTSNAARDTHLKSTDFFAEKQFPEITFESKSIKALDDKTWEVTGDLTIKGTTKSITVKLEKVGEGKSPTGAPTVGFETTFAIKRSDFKMDKMLDAVGDDVTITFALEADKS